VRTMSRATRAPAIAAITMTGDEGVVISAIADLAAQATTFEFHYPPPFLENRKTLGYRFRQ
jgi:hypothetical protein